ncbi:hypothetical protein Pelo_19600 [Pelomyxa schiedti]|nr:hypothetical protein Pelo_19600 [Pelomyxa schiedti]
MLDPTTQNLTSNSLRKDEITKEFWAPLLGPISSDGEALKTLLSKYKKKLGAIPMLTPDDVEAAILSCKSKSAPAIILCNMFHWLTKHTAPPHFNDSLFFAFPKVEGTTRIDESRPISPPNTDNHIITKTMAYLLNPCVILRTHRQTVRKAHLQDSRLDTRRLSHHLPSSEIKFTERSSRYPRPFP